MRTIFLEQAVNLPMQGSPVRTQGIVMHDVKENSLFDFR
jgi:hypothetical protein